MSFIISKLLDPNRVGTIWEDIEKNARWRYVPMVGDHYHWNWPVMNLGGGAEWYPDAPDWIRGIADDLLEDHPDMRLNRVVINGQTQHMNSAIHRDSLYPDSRTYLLYLNPRWDQAWGGHTLFFGPDKQTIHTDAVLPVPGTMVIYPGNIYHQGLGPAVNGILRVTMSVQMITTK